MRKEQAEPPRVPNSPLSFYGYSNEGKGIHFEKENIGA